MLRNVPLINAAKTFLMFSFTLDIYCTSVRPGRGIPHMWLSLRFLVVFPYSCWGQRMSHLVKALWDKLWFVNMGYTNEIWLIDWLKECVSLNKTIKLTILQALRVWYQKWVFKKWKAHFWMLFTTLALSFYFLLIFQNMKNFETNTNIS